MYIYIYPGSGRDRGPPGPVAGTRFPGNLWSNSSHVNQVRRRVGANYHPYMWTSAIYMEHKADVHIERFWKIAVWKIYAC